MRASNGFLVVLGLIIAGAASAGPEGFYAGKAQGWFWYRNALPPPLPPEPVPPPPPSPAAAIAPVAAVPPPAPLSAAWMRENLDRYRDRAIDDPTPENVAAFFYLQRVVLDKSSTFATVAARVVQGNPDLDEITQRPTATFGANLANKTAGDARDAVLGRIAQHAVVWFFFRSDCPYCDAQAPLLELMSQRYGFTVLPIALDGAPLPSGLFPTFRTDAGQSRALGVRATPALFLVRPDPAGPQVAAVAQGLLSLAQLQERFVTAAVTAGWITQAEGTPSRAVTTDVSAAALLHAGDLPDDPAALVARLRDFIHD